MVRKHSTNRAVEKPPYRVPTMAEIAEVRGTNGYTVVSTFSGAGGSCLGFEMAGFEILWASEFVPAAAEVYRLNHPGVPLDTRDIRQVQPEEILERIGRKRGEIDVLEGSPPCASFSTAGKRAKGWGHVRKYSDTKQRTDDLFFEFARILEGLQPRMFVAENVAGLVKGVAKGYFLEILARLKACGYQVEARVLDAQWLGVPQTRKRLIILGSMGRLKIRAPKPRAFRYSLRDAIRDLEESNDYRQKLSPRMRSWWEATPPGETLDTGSRRLGDTGHGHTQTRLAWGRPASAILQTANAGTREAYHPDIPASLTIAEAKRVMSFPDAFKLTGEHRYQWERLGRAVPPVMMYHIAKAIETSLKEADSCAES